MEIFQTENNETVTIPQKSVSEAPKLLGFKIAANGSWHIDLGRWRAEAERFAAAVKRQDYSMLWQQSIFRHLAG